MSSADRSNSKPLTVLVTDDSNRYRDAIASIVSGFPNVEVVGLADDGKRALSLALSLRPDVIMLDLEMPEMDGFSFLRLLMSRRPTPVIVISSHAQRENVFRALELGALDFVAKPADDRIDLLAHDLAQKIEVVRRLQSIRVDAGGPMPAPTTGSAPDLAAEASTASEARLEYPPATLSGAPAAGVIGLAASTGGPPAIQHVLGQIPADFPLAILIAQHMPPRFTEAYAQRLHRRVALDVVEAVDGQPLVAGAAYIAPGSMNLGVRIHVQRGRGKVLVGVSEPPPSSPGGQISPSADHLFSSLGRCFGRRACCIVLTGMGTDGRRGVQTARGMGARIIAEDPATAAMPSMPQAVVAAGLADEIVPLYDIPTAMMRFAEFCRRNDRP